MLYFSLPGDIIPRFNFNSSDDLWSHLSSLRHFSSTIDRKLWRLIQLEKLGVNMLESDLVDILRENKNDHILDEFSITTWALLHIAYDGCLDKSKKMLFSTMKLLFNSTLNNMPCCLFFLSQFDFDINQHNDVSDNILLSQNAWAQLVLLSLPKFDITRVDSTFIRDQLIQVLNANLCEFMKSAYMLSIRRRDAEKFLDNIIYLGLNEHIAHCSIKTLESLVSLSEVAQHETNSIQTFYATLTGMNDYTSESIKNAVKKLLQHVGFDIKSYYNGSSEAFKRLPETAQAAWLEDWFSVNDSAILESSADFLQTDPLVLQDPSVFISRLLQKHLPVFVRNLPVRESFTLVEHGLLDYRIRKIFELTLTLENPYLNQVYVNKEFMAAFLWHKITFYKQAKKQVGGVFHSVSLEKQNKKIDFLNHLLENFEDIKQGKFSIEDYYYSHYSQSNRSAACDLNVISAWVEDVLLYNRDKTVGSYAAKILACLSHYFLKSIFLIYTSEELIRERAFPGKGFTTAEECLKEMFSAQSAPSAASSRAGTPCFLSRRGSNEDLYMTPVSLFRPIGRIADAEMTSFSAATTLPDDNSPGWFIEAEVSDFGQDNDSSMIEEFNSLRSLRSIFKKAIHPIRRKSSDGLTELSVTKSSDKKRSFSFGFS